MTLHSLFCPCLVTVIIPLDSLSIEIDLSSFYCWRTLANLALPKGSNTRSNTVAKCKVLQDRFGEGADSILEGLVSRFDDFRVQKKCFSNSSISAQQLSRCNFLHGSLCGLCSLRIYGSHINHGDGLVERATQMWMEQ